MKINSNNVSINLALVALSSGGGFLALATAELNALAVTELHLHPAPVVGVSDGGVAGVDLSELTGAGNFFSSHGTGLLVEASSRCGKPAFSLDLLDEASSIVLGGTFVVVVGLGVSAA